MDISDFSRFPANENLRRNVLHLSLWAKSSFTFLHLRYPVHVVPHQGRWWYTRTRRTPWRGPPSTSASPDPTRRSSSIHKRDSSHNSSTISGVIFLKFLYLFCLNKQFVAWAANMKFIKQLTEGIVCIFLTVRLPFFTVRVFPV